MFKTKTITRIFSAMLAMLMAFIAIGNSYTYAESGQFISSNIEIVAFDDGLYSYERDVLGETLTIKKINTNDEYIVFKSNKSVYLKDNDGNVSKVASIKESESILPFSTNSDWIEFGPDRYDFDLEGITAITVVVGIIAGAIGGPAAGVKAALASLGAGAVYNGVYAYKWGKYRFYSSNGIEGEYWSQLYQPTGKKLGSEIYWKGKR